MTKAAENEKELLRYRIKEDCIGMKDWTGNSICQQQGVICEPARDAQSHVKGESASPHSKLPSVHEPSAAYASQLSLFCQTCV